MKVLSIRLDDEIYNQVSQKANEERRSINAQINRALELAHKHWAIIVANELEKSKNARSPSP